jgi:hypothetical protein
MSLRTGLIMESVFDRALSLIMVSIVTIIAVAVSRYLSWLQQKGVEVKQDAKLDSIHQNVNSGRLRTLKLLSEVSRWKADQQPTDENLKAAEDADREYKDQLDQQVAADQRKYGHFC